MERRAWIEVDIKKIIKNIEIIKNYTGTKFMACVKGNCYGMGMYKISKEIERYVDAFGVATTSEAIELRDGGIRKPVLVMGPILPGDVEVLMLNNISITLFNEEILKAIKSVIEKRNIAASVHIKVDTGLGRIGLPPEKIPAFIEKVSSVRGIQIDGIFSHFATAGWKDKTYAKEQLDKFNRTLKSIEKVNIPLKHIANSPSILNIPESYKNFDMIRIGLLLFGVYTEKYLWRKLSLQRPLKGYCRVLYIKSVPAGTFLSYGLTYRTKKKSQIATAGIGYQDGLRRGLSNNFHFLWKGHKVKIVGNICMDQTLIDVTGKSVKSGDILQIFGDNLEIEEMAEILQTTPQEILCGFGSERMEKIYKL
ncbi:MAG: alanine racemase [Candidatus Omnitrophica bacterium]|nr:alanine racemase [Candidatus Omnitrophota bacterium]